MAVNPGRSVKGSLTDHIKRRQMPVGSSLKLWIPVWIFVQLAVGARARRTVSINLSRRLRDDEILTGKGD